MSEFSEFIHKIFDTSDFPPRWHCGYWSGLHGWLYIISDLAIWGAYFAIPIIIVRYITKRHDARFVRLYFLFAAFILACGSTHLLDAITFWYPFYRVSAVVRLITAIVSWATVFSLIRLLPQAFSLKSAEQFQAEIDERKIVEEKLRINNFLLTEAQEIARLGHWQWDVVNNRVTWSDMTLKLFGVNPEEKEMSYDTYLTKIHPDDISYVDNMIKSSLEQKVFSKFYHRVISPDRKVKIFLSRGEIISNSSGKVIKMIGTVQDITELKNTEQELLLKSQELEASNLELQKFASIASHDLREPLRKIIMFGSLLEKETSGALEEKSKMYLDKITGSALRMQRLIDDILDLTKLSVSENTYVSLNLRNVINQVLSDIEVLITASGAQIEIGDFPEIEGNEAQLGQLFQNLISNAIKFAKEGEAPHIRITSSIIDGTSLPNPRDITDSYNYAIVKNPELVTSDRYCRIVVADKGIGFDPEYADKIFLIFQRLHDKRAYDGTGIGLAVCKKVVELHSGYITAKSQPGKGTEFVIFLPLFQMQMKEH